MNALLCSVAILFQLFVISHTASVHRVSFFLQYSNWPSVPKSQLICQKKDRGDRGDSPVPPIRPPLFCQYSRWLCG
jgi:hypothetical protein